MIRNLNTDYGMTTEKNAPTFESVEELVGCLNACGFDVYADDLVDGVDYESL